MLPQCQLIGVCVCSMQKTQSFSSMITEETDKPLNKKAATAVYGRNWPFVAVKYDCMEFVLGQNTELGHVPVKRNMC